MEKIIAVLAGDGIGEEIMFEALRVLDAVAELYGHTWEYRRAAIGGAAFDQFQTHCPQETLATCRESDAILFGSVGGPVSKQHEPKWKNCEAQSILALRKAFAFGINLRPVRIFPSLAALSPLRTEIIYGGVDILFIRELLGDIYFGEHSTQGSQGSRIARDVAEYTEEQVRTIATFAFQAARFRSKKIHSVDKANVLDTSRLWRSVVTDMSKEFPDVVLEHILVDNCAMQLLRNPRQFDVVLAPNMFGDILSDEAAMIPGSLGLLPSASLSPSGFGLYEPAGGSAPDIAGKGIANPVGQILSAALMLRYSFGLEREAQAIEQAVGAALEASGTPDLARDASRSVSTSVLGSTIVSLLK